MPTTLPRITTATVTGPTSLKVTWKDGSTDVVDLAGWVATGGDILAPLRDGDIFGSPRVDSHGASLYWGDPDGDLSIDAFHLRQLAEEQRPFDRNDMADWQKAMRLSNQEAATFLHVGLSTWNGYKAGANIPPTVVMLCRAAQRDPLLMQAHYRPRKPGRPRKSQLA